MMSVYVHVWLEVCAHLHLCTPCLVCACVFVRLSVCCAFAPSNVCTCTPLLVCTSTQACRYFYTTVRVPVSVCLSVTVRVCLHVHMYLHVLVCKHAPMLECATTIIAITYTTIFKAIIFLICSNILDSDDYGDLPHLLQPGRLSALPFSMRKKTKLKKIRICANRPTLLLLNPIYIKIFKTHLIL